MKKVITQVSFGKKLIHMHLCPSLICQPGPNHHLSLHQLQCSLSLFLHLFLCSSQLFMICWSDKGVVPQPQFKLPSLNTQLASVYFILHSNTLILIFLLLCKALSQPRAFMFVCHKTGWNTFPYSSSSLTTHTSCPSLNATFLWETFSVPA